MVGTLIQEGATEVFLSQHFEKAFTDFGGLFDFNQLLFILFVLIDHESNTSLTSTISPDSTYFWDALQFVPLIVRGMG